LINIRSSYEHEKEEPPTLFWSWLHHRLQFQMILHIATINNICPTGILHDIEARYQNFINVRS